MKILLTFLFSFLIAESCFSSNTEEKLPEIPWRAIAETCRDEIVNNWNGMINVKLFGNYDSTDVRMVEHSIKELNPLLGTINLVLSGYDRGNIEIYFLDSTNFYKYKSIITLNGSEQSTWRSSFNTTREGRQPAQVSMAVNTGLVPTEYRQNFLTNNLAFSLFPYYWNDIEWKKNNRTADGLPPSIFRATDVGERKQLFYKALPEFDQKILSTVYSPDFKAKLAVAKEQYKTYHISEWLRRYARQFILLPSGILFLLMLFVFLKISKAIEKGVTNQLFRLNLNGVIGLLMIAILVSAYLVVSDSIRWYKVIKPNDFLINFRNISLAVLIVGLPAINMLRVVEKQIHRNTHKKVLKTVLIFLSTGLIPFSAYLAITALFKRNDSPFITKDEIEFISFVFMIIMIIAAFRALISYFFFKEKDLVIENETKLIHLRELKTKAELNALHSRINPHFLYNSLNSIAGLAHTNADQTEHMALSLSKLFRYSINKEKSDWTTFHEELEMVKIYLDVEKVRFDDRLVYSIEIAEEMKELKIPRFIIQPLAENAVKHGISQSVEGGEIKIKIQKDKKDILITVEDSGKEFPQDLTPGFGLQSIYDKLEILYGDKFELSFTNSPVKQVSLKLK
ncbi:sensor histidine kinase [Maribellus mangrovi]|uniref:sensor histidine kinase n=1 Tax=Maribellus mangrovi TaxID=3133146 RepID=UPI0030EDB814